MGREPIVTQADRLEAERSSHANTTLAGQAFLESTLWDQRRAAGTESGADVDDGGDDDDGGRRGRATRADDESGDESDDDGDDDEER